MEPAELQPHLLAAVFALFGVPPPPDGTADAEVYAALDELAPAPEHLSADYWTDKRKG